MTNITEVVWIAIPAFSSLLYVLLFLLRRRDLGPVARWFTAFLGSAAIWSLGSMLLHANPPLIDPVWWARLTVVGNTGIPLAMFAFTVYFLSLSRQRSLIVAMVVAFSLILVLNVAGFVVISTEVDHGLVTNHYGWGIYVSSAYWALCFYPAIFLLIREMRRTHDQTFRNRLQFLLLTFVLLLAASLLNLTPLSAYPLDHLLAGVTAVLISLSISRYQVLELRRVVRRLGALSLIILLYVTAISAALYILAGVERSLLLPTSIAAALITVGVLVSFRPVREGVSGLINRFFVPDQYNIQALIYAISRISNRLRLRSELGTDILRELSRTLLFQCAALFIQDESDNTYKLVAEINLPEDSRNFTLQADSPLIRELRSYRMAMHIGRLRELPRLQAVWVDEWAMLAKIRAEVLTPILLEDQLVGIFVFGSRSGSDPYTHQEMQEVLPLIANQVSIALSNSSLYTREQTRANVLAQTNIELRQTQHALGESAARSETLLRVADRLNAQLELDVVLNAVCEETVRALNVPAASVSLYSEKDALLHHVSDLGFPSEYRFSPRPVQRSASDDNAQQDSSIRIFPDAQVTDGQPDQEISYALNVRTIVCANMLREGNMVGTLSIFTFGQMREFKPDELALLKGIAVLAADAITNARLYDVSKRRLRQMQALRDVDSAIMGNEDLQLTLKVVLNHIVSQLHIDAVDVLLVNEKTNGLEFAAGKGFHNTAPQYAPLQLGKGNAGIAALSRQPVFVDNINDTGNRSEYVVPVTSEGFVAYVAMPLIAKGQVKGVLEIYHRAPLERDSEWLFLLDALTVQAAIAIDNGELFANLQRTNSELNQAYDSTLDGWARTLELRDQETEGHTRRVAEITEKLARIMGLGEEEILNIHRGALLHDIGKLGVPDSILLKPGPLTPAEWRIMRLHPIYAYQVLKPITFLNKSMDIPYCHHEKWDGTGYPQGLQGEQIPLAARIFMVVDVWDALHSDRPYHKAWRDEDIIAYLNDESGKFFDPHIVEIFLQSFSLSAWAQQAISPHKAAGFVDPAKNNSNSPNERLETAK